MTAPKPSDPPRLVVTVTGLEQVPRLERFDEYRRRVFAAAARLSAADLERRINATVATAAHRAKGGRVL